MRLFPFFILIPIVELYILLKVGSIIGPAMTIGIIFITAAIGYRLFRAQGLEKLQKVRSTMAGASSSNDLAMDIAEGAAILVAGILLLTPGLLTDAFGFACLIPATRKWIVRKIISKAVVNANGSFQYHSSTDTRHSQQPQKNSNSNEKSTRVIEGEVIEEKSQEKE